MSAFSATQILQRLGVRLPRIVSDSRRIKPGDAFAAYPGEKADGRNFVADAIARGAAAVLYEPQGALDTNDIKVPSVAVSQLKQRLGEIAAELHGHPARQLQMIGVTGTNGKTSSTHWVAQALTRLGRKCAVVGTLGNGFPGELQETANTTPDAAELQETLADLLRRGATAVAMEVSSHGLEQGRVNAVPFAMALFTNLTRDHLDYHGSMAAYSAAKAKLFAWPGLEVAVINADDAQGAQFIADCTKRGQRVISYGFSAATLSASALVQGPQGLVFQLRSPWGNAQVESPLVGAFNAYNLLGVLGILIACGIDFEPAVHALRQCQSVAGRMQRYGRAGQPMVVVDYAHTPDALDKALTALRPAVSAGGQLICVFGCGGDRDPGKRPQMGAIAAQLADRVWVTSDNPRSESPQLIIDGIVAGIAVAARGKITAEADRGAAIAHAIAGARAEDVVLIAGKGHEPYQEIAGRRTAFSDAEQASAALAQWRPQ